VLRRAPKHSAICSSQIMFDVQTMCHSLMYKVMIIIHYV
jgi:hypothetical protein